MLQVSSKLKVLSLNWTSSINLKYWLQSLPDENSMHRCVWPEKKAGTNVLLVENLMLSLSGKSRNIGKHQPLCPRKYVTVEGPLTHTRTNDCLAVGTVSFVLLSRFSLGSKKGQGQWTHLMLWWRLKSMSPYCIDYSTCWETLRWTWSSCWIR